MTSDPTDDPIYVALAARHEHLAEQVECAEIELDRAHAAHDAAGEMLEVYRVARREAERLAEKPIQTAKFAAPAPRAAPCNYGDGA